MVVPSPAFGSDGIEDRVSLLAQQNPTLLAFGANLPNGANAPSVTIERALLDLEASGVSVLHVSPFYVTAPVPATGQPDFVNCVTKMTSELTPDELMKLCAETEKAHGRAREQSRQRWDARTLDIDILAFDDLILPGLEAWNAEAERDGGQAAPARLTIPHPRLHARGFVLVPLADVAPAWQHPVFGLTSQQLLHLHAKHHPDDVKNVKKMTQ